MIKGDSSDYELLEQWTKDFDCDGFAAAAAAAAAGGCRLRRSSRAARSTC